MQRDSFIFLREWRDTIHTIKDKDAQLRLMDAIMDYALDGISHNEDDSLFAAIISSFKGQIDRQNEAYLRRVEANRINGQKGGRPRQNTETQPIAENPLGYLGFSETQSVSTHYVESSDIDNIEQELDININNKKKKSTQKKKKALDLSIPREEREKSLYDEIAKYVGKYDRQMLRNFYNHWTQPLTADPNMMLFEAEKAFEVGKRLATWASKPWNQPQQQYTQLSLYPPQPQPQPKKSKLERSMEVQRDTRALIDRIFDEREGKTNQNNDIDEQ